MPGQPITSLSREGDAARAFSPGRGQYVLVASGIDYARADLIDGRFLAVVRKLAEAPAGCPIEARVLGADSSRKP